MRLQLIAALTIFVGGFAQAQSIRTTEPERGELRSGQSVMVDDGTCPKGQIKLVSGGKGGRDDPNSRRRTKSCIKRP